MIINFKTYQQKREAMNTSPKKMADVLGMVIDTLKLTNQTQMSDRRLMANGNADVLAQAIECHDATKDLLDYAEHFLRMYKIKEKI